MKWRLKTNAMGSNILIIDQLEFTSPRVVVIPNLKNSEDCYIINEVGKEVKSVTVVKSKNV